MFVGVYFLDDCLKSKSNPIYFKQKIIIQDVIFIFTQKHQMHKCNICDYNFWGHIVLLPKFVLISILIIFNDLVYVVI